jgi:hypothetical protein
MEISVLTKFLLRIIKDNHFTHHLNKDIKFKLSLYDVNLSYLIMKSKISPQSKYRKIIDKLRMFFNIEEYINHTYSHKNNIVITNIVNYEKLIQYLEFNGVMWGNNKRCTTFTPIDNFENEIYLKLYVDECRIYYGRSYRNLIGDIVLTENEFYEYYENYKKELNKVFYDCLLQNYGNFKKK